MTTNAVSRIVKGRGTEIVLAGDGGPVIISGGSAMRLEFKSADGKGTISLVTKNGPSTTIAEGGAQEMAREYDRMCSDLMQPAQPSYSWKSIFAGALATAAIFAAFQQPLAPRDAPGQPSAMPSAAQVPMQVPNLIPALEALKERVQTANEANAAGDSSPDGADGKATETATDATPPLLDRPDFLKVPDVLPEIPDPAPTASAAPEISTPANVSETEEEPGLPAYSPDLYAAPAPKVPAVLETSEQADPAPASASEPVAKKKDDKSAAVDTSEEAGATAAASTGPETDGPEAAQPSAAAEDASVKPAGTSEADKEKIAEQARKAAQELVAKGLTPDKALDVLKQLETLGRSDFSNVTPDMLATLPHEVAHMLIEKGLVNSEDAPEGVQYSIIRLPESKMEEYRGEDGIASIPERNTWASTGNFVSIPLPGGGDIKQPSDMAEFGLKP